MQLNWFDRQGRNLGPAAQLGDYLDLALSPNASRAAATRRDANNTDIWLLEFARGGPGARFTFDAAIDTRPVWAPDGSQIVFSSSRNGPPNLYRKPSSGAGEETELLKTAEPVAAQDWSRDGRFLLYVVTSPKTGADLWVLPMEGDRKPTPFLATPFRETHGQFSPGPANASRWIAYDSNATGRPEVYVRPFPASSAGQWMVSTAGGGQPRWRRDGKELFYLSLERKLMSVEIGAGATFQAGTPKPLFAAPFPLADNLVSTDLGCHRGRPFPGQRYAARYRRIADHAGDELAVGVEEMSRVVGQAPRPAADALVGPSQPLRHSTAGPGAQRRRGRLPHPDLLLVINSCVIDLSPLRVDALCRSH